MVSQVSSRIGKLLQHYHVYKLKLTSKLTENFLKPNHGKGTVDGIGGIIKRLAGRRVVTGKSIITDSVLFFNAVS